MSTLLQLIMLPVSVCLELSACLQLIGQMIASAVAGLLGLPWWVLPGAIPAAEFVQSAMLAPHSRENEAEADEVAMNN